MIGAYYNEIDPYAAQWLRNLITAGHIAPGDVDERSIEDVKPDDLRQYKQCHFFAGIGVWSHSLRRAGWSDDRPVWTGSCPCQPFSDAGKGAGFDDERHLWPSFQWLIQELRPEHIFGEQVASKSADVWFDLVQADLEGMGYTFGLVPYPSAGVGAPHIRDRAYWVAHADMQHKSSARNQTRLANTGWPLTVGRVANTSGNGWQGGVSGRQAPQRKTKHGSVGCGCPNCRPGPVNGFWRDSDWLYCRDGKWRPVRPGTFPLVNGAPSRVGRLRAYGNAINAEASAEFIRAYMEVR